MAEVIEESQLQFHCPFRLVAIGPSGSGKTTFCRRMIKHQKYLFDRPADRIVVFYTEMNEQVKKISKLDKVEVIKDFNQDIIDDWVVEDGHMLVIIDDHLMVKSAQESFAELWAIKSRAKFISCALLTQSMSPHDGASNKWGKIVLLNSTITILFCNKRDESIMRQIGRTAFSGRFKYFVSAYREAVCDKTKIKKGKGNYKYLAIFSDPTTSRNCELRARIFFRNEHTILFYPRKWTF